MGQPSELYTLDFVPQGGADELEVVANSPVALNVVVKVGRAVSGGVNRLYPREVVTIATADPTDPRIDLVEARRDGLLNVVTGTPAPSPVAPAPTSGAVRLATVSVLATVTVINNGDITDVRPRTPHCGAFIRDSTITQAKFGITVESREIPYACGGMSVNPQNNHADASLSVTSLSIIGGATGPVTGVQTLQLPDGSSITNVSLNFTADITGVNASFSVFRIPRTGAPPFNAIFSASYPNAGTGELTISDATPTPAGAEVVDNTAFHYSVAINIDAPGNPGVEISARTLTITVDTTQILS